MIRVTISLRQFMAMLERAAFDDKLWPGLCYHSFLLQRAIISDTEVILTF